MAGQELHGVERAHALPTAVHPPPLCTPPPDPTRLEAPRIPCPPHPSPCTPE